LLAELQKVDGWQLEDGFIFSVTMQGGVFRRTEERFQLSHKLEAMGMEGIEDVVKRMCVGFDVDRGGSILEGAFPVLGTLRCGVHVSEEEACAIATYAVAFEGEGF
jgi:hypothetical protein